MALPSSNPPKPPSSSLFAVRIQTLVGAALLTLLDGSLVSDALAMRNAAPALFAVGVTVAWAALVALAWRSQRRG